MAITTFKMKFDDIPKDYYGEPGPEETRALKCLNKLLEELKEKFEFSGYKNCFDDTPEYVEMLLLHKPEENIHLSARAMVFEIWKLTSCFIPIEASVVHPGGVDEEFSFGVEEYDEYALENINIIQPGALNDSHP